MHHCPSCGTPFKQRKNVCPHCGISREEIPDTEETRQTSATLHSTQSVAERKTKLQDLIDANEDLTRAEKSEIWLFPVGHRLGRLIWIVFGFLLPPLGIFMFFALANKKPDIGIAAGLGAIICLVIAFSILGFVVWFGLD